MKRFIYAVKITLVYRIYFTRLSLPPHCVFCWIAHNRAFQHFSAGNINSPFNTISRRHHPVRTDDWTVTPVSTMVLKRHLKALLMRRFTESKQRLLGRRSLNRLRNLDVRNYFLEVKDHSFTWYGKSAMSTGRPPTIRPSRRGRLRVAAPEISARLRQG